MRKYTIAVATLVVCALFSTSCTNPTSNANNASANNNSVVQTNTNGPAKTPPPDPCAGTDIQAKLTAVTTYLNEQISQNPKLNAQKTAGTFDFRVINPSGTGYLTLYLGGLMSVNHGSSNGLLNHLNGMVDPIMQEKCVVKIDLVALSALPPLGKPATDDAGFEWTACDYPANPCPDGTCSQGCSTVVSPTPTVSPTGTPRGGNTNQTP